MGLVAIEGMEFFAYHGYYAQEKEHGNTFIVDIYIKTKLDSAAESDKLSDTIDYENVYKIVEQIMGEKYNLLEHIAHQILQQLKQELNSIKGVKIRVSKLNPPVKGKVKRTYIELDKQF